MHQLEPNKNNYKFSGWYSEQEIHRRALTQKHELASDSGSENEE